MKWLWKESKKKKLKRRKYSFCLNRWGWIPRFFSLSSINFSHPIKHPLFILSRFSAQPLPVASGQLLKSKKRLHSLAFRRTGCTSADVATGRGVFSRPTLVGLVQDVLASTFATGRGRLLVDVHPFKRRFSFYFLFPILNDIMMKWNDRMEAFLHV